jgi:microcystin-dependent protein
MKKHLILLVSLISFLSIFVLLGLAQTRDEFKQKYGLPDDKGRYVVRPDIGLSIEYKQGQNPSEMVIKPLDSDAANASNSEKENSRKVMLSDEAEEVLDELVPVAKRGERGFVAKLLSGCISADRTEYEQVTIDIVKRCERRGGGTYSISVHWKE